MICNQIILIPLFIFSNPKYLDEAGVKEILGQLDIDSPSISAEEKIKILCTVFKTSITENVK